MAALSTVSVKFVAIGLTTQLAGSYNSAYGFLQLFAILADFGLYAVSVREVSQAKDPKRVLGALLVLRCAIMTISLGSALIIVWLMPAWSGTPLPMGVTIAALVPFFTLLSGVLRTIFQITYNMHLVFIAEVTQRVISTGLMSIPILLGVRHSTSIVVYHQLLLAGGMGAVVLFALSVVFAFHLLPVQLCFDRTLLKRILRASLPYGVAYVCVALYRQFDLTMIALLHPDFQLQNAYYGFAGRITEMTYLVPTFLLNSILPILSKRHANGERTQQLLGKTLLSILIIGSLAALFSALWARPIMQLLTTDAYLSTPTHPGADTALSMLSIPQLLNGMVLYSFYVLLTLHEWRALVRTMLLGVVLSIGMNIWLIPHHGFVGAAMTSITVHAFLVVLLLPQALRRMSIVLPWQLLLRWLGFSATVRALLFLVAPLLTHEWKTVLAILLILPSIAAMFVGFRLHRSLIGSFD